MDICLYAGDRTDDSCHWLPRALRQEEALSARLTVEPHYRDHPLRVDMPSP